MALLNSSALLHSQNYFTLCVRVYGGGCMHTTVQSEEVRGPLYGVSPTTWLSGRLNSGCLENRQEDAPLKPQSSSGAGKRLTWAPKAWGRPSFIYAPANQKESKVPSASLQHPASSGGRCWHSDLGSSLGLSQRCQLALKNLHLFLLLLFCFFSGCSFLGLVKNIFPIRGTFLG